MNKIPFVLNSSIHNAFGEISIIKNLNLPALVETKELKSLIYDPSENSNTNTTFFAWSLEYLSYKKFAILNGSWGKWVLDQLPVSQEFSPFPSRKFFGKVFNEISAEKRYILKRFPEKI